MSNFDSPCVAIIKHANPCGIAVGHDIAAAYRLAHETDPVSAFGGVIAANREVSLAMAEAVIDVFTDTTTADMFNTGMLNYFKSKAGNVYAYLELKIAAEISRLFY